MERDRDTKRQTEKDKGRENTINKIRGEMGHAPVDHNEIQRIIREYSEKSVF